MKNKLFAAAAIVLSTSFLCMTLLAGCSNSSSEPNSNNSDSATQNQTTTQEAPAEIAAAADTLRIGSMKGPTSVGLAYMMENSQGQFTVAAAADEIAPKLLQGDLDIALVPANLAATLYQRSNGAIQVIDINTLGVLYAVSAADVSTISELRGKTVYMTGKGTVPEYTLLALLKANGMSTDDIDLQFRSEPAEVAALISQDHEAIGILPQPYATSVTLKDDAVKECIDLNTEWEKATDGSFGNIITGVTVAKKSTIDEQPEVIEEFLRRHAVSAETAQTNADAIADEVVSLGIIDNDKIAEAAIPKCNVVFIAGEEMKTALSGYLNALFEQNPESLGGALPDDGFYLL